MNKLFLSGAGVSTVLLLALATIKMEALVDVLPSLPVVVLFSVMGLILLLAKDKKEE